MNIYSLRFDWNSNKSNTNRKKHGVSFKEAESVFNDDLALLYDDPDHSVEEDRFLLVGMSNHYRILIISHCYYEEESVIRIISARKATFKETKEYWNLRS